MSSPLQSLEPKILWSHFDEIRKIPRPSKHEGRIIEHIRKWASQRKLELLSDAAGSLVIRVPATTGRESSPVVILQGHLDMVCEKNSGIETDFMTDGIKVKVEGDWVKAEGTTLGADNGIGLAAAMAIADDPESEHGPIEILCTVDEETGLTGAMQLEPEIITGRIMLNLDTEEDGAVYIGCAGGADSTATLDFSRRRGLLRSVPARLAVTGLRGGHSGLNIIENRANAIKLATRVLLAAQAQGIELDLASIDGGSKHNAIPREAFAVVRIPKNAVAELGAVAVRCARDFFEEFGSIEPDMSVTVEALDEAEDYQLVLNAHARDRLLRLLDGLPHGVLAMSREVPGLVESSTNLAVVKTEADAARIVASHRSSIMPALFAVRQQVGSIFEQAGAKVSVRDAYPGWKPNPSSPIVRKTIAVFEEMFGKSPEVKAIHAGLECGLLIEKLPGLDAVSIGPQIENAHSPDEMVQISSVARFYEHVKGILKAIN